VILGDLVGSCDEIEIPREHARGYYVGGCLQFFDEKTEYYELANTFLFVLLQAICIGMI